jgi:hypothetical protein
MLVFNVLGYELAFKAHCDGSGTDFSPTHDLVTLDKTVNLTTSKDENGILKVLTE